MSQSKEQGSEFIETASLRFKIFNLNNGNIFWNESQLMQAIINARINVLALLFPVLNNVKLFLKCAYDSTCPTVYQPSIHFVFHII